MADIPVSQGWVGYLQTLGYNCRESQGEEEQVGQGDERRTQCPLSDG